MSERRLPRVLLVGPNALDRSVAGGPALAALFAEWRREDLAQINSDPREPDTSLASTFYRLNDGERLVGPLPMRQAIRFWRFATGRGEMTTLFFSRITRRLESWLDRFRPEVIFSELGGLPMARLSLEIARRYRIPLVLWIGDDWVTGWPSNSLRRTMFPLTHLAHRQMTRLFGRALAQAESVAVVSDEMANEYERRYGRKCRILHNGVDLSEWPAREARDARSPSRILYSGSIFPYAQSTSLEDVRDAVGLLRHDGHPVELVIRTRDAGSDTHRAAFDGVPGVELRGLSPRADLPRDLGGADILLLPVNFDLVTIDFIRFTIPTKVAEYLASGAPILYYGPPDVAQARFLERNGCGLLVTTRDGAQLRAGIIRLIDDRALRRRLSANARRAAERSYDILALRSELDGIIAGAMAHGAGRA